LLLLCPEGTRYSPVCVLLSCIDLREITETDPAMVCAHSELRIGLQLEDYCGFIVGKCRAEGFFGSTATPTDVLLTVLC